MFDSHIHIGSVKRLGDLERYCDRLNLNGGALLSLPLPNGGTFNREVLSAGLQLPGRFFLFAVPDTDTDPQQEIVLLQQAGFNGLKIIDSKPALRLHRTKKLTGPWYSDLFQAAQDLKMPVIIHAADPPDFWNDEYADQSRYQPFESFIGEAFSVAEKHTRLTLIFAHMLFLAKWPQRMGDFFDSCPNAHLDLAPGRYFYQEISSQKDKFRDIFKQYSNRFLAGSDAMFCDENTPDWFGVTLSEPLEDSLLKFNQLYHFLTADKEMPNPYRRGAPAVPSVTGPALPKEVIQKIFGKNFEKIIGNIPPAINRDEAEKYCRTHGGIHA